MARTHTCSNCGKSEEWSDSWMWYGSESDLDDGKSIVKACSEECRKALFQRGTTHSHSPGKPISKRKAARLEAELKAEAIRQAKEVRARRSELRQRFAPVSPSNT